MARQECGRSALVKCRDAARPVVSRFVIQPAAYPYRGLVLRIGVGAGSPALDKGRGNGQQARKDAKLWLGYAGRRVGAYAEPYGQFLNRKRDGHRPS